MLPNFEHYVHARGAVLLRFAYVICGDHRLAEYLVQEALARAHRRWTRIESDNPDAYLKQAVVRTHLSWWRRRSNREAPCDTLPPIATGDFTQRHAERDETWHVLATLPRTQRAVLVLRFFEDLDDEAIATVIGCGRATVRVHAHRGLTALRSRVSHAQYRLTTKAMAFPVPFKVTLAPAGFTEVTMTERATGERMLCLVPPRQEKQTEQMCVWMGRKVLPPASWTPPPYTPGGFGPLGTRRVTVDLSDGRTIVVNTTLPSDRLSDNEMREVGTTLVLS